MKIALTLFFICGVFSTSLKQLRKLKADLEQNPILTEHKNKKKLKKQRKLFMDNDFQTGSAYVQQIQDTNNNLNEMMNHSKRQSELKQVGQMFESLSLKLDDFRDGVSRKLNELHMTLQRPKVPMTGPAPGVVYHGGVQFKERLLETKETKKL